VLKPTSKVFKGYRAAKYAIDDQENRYLVIARESFARFLFIRGNKAYILSFTVNLMPKKGAVV